MTPINNSNEADDDRPEPLGILPAKRDDQTLRFYSENFADEGIIEVPLADLHFDKADKWTNYLAHPKHPSSWQLIWCSTLLKQSHIHCAVQLVNKADVEAFKENVGKVYEEKIGYAPAFYIAEIADGTKKL